MYACPDTFGRTYQAAPSSSRSYCGTAANGCWCSTLPNCVTRFATFGVVSRLRSTQWSSCPTIFMPSGRCPGNILTRLGSRHRGEKSGDRVDRNGYGGLRPDGLTHPTKSCEKFFDRVNRNNHGGLRPAGLTHPTTSRGCSTLRKFTSLVGWVSGNAAPCPLSPFCRVG